MHVTVTPQPDTGFDPLNHNFIGKTKNFQTLVRPAGIGHNSYLAVARFGRDPGSAFCSAEQNMPAPFDS